MAEATPESNLALIEELQALVSADYAAPEGPEFSYPAVGQAVDDEMWKFITLALGNGILDDGGEPYYLRKLGSDSQTNSENQMRLTVATSSGNAQAVLGGFYHRLLEDMRLTFPMPLTRTVYYVTLELNPLKAKSALGPISVQVYPNELNTESNRQHLILWTVTRDPNQLLTEATVTRYRPRVAPAITVAREEDKPDPSTVLWGSTCVVHRTNTIYVAVGSTGEGETGGTRWKGLDEPNATYTRPDGVYKWVGHGAKPGASKIGQVVYLEGRLARGDRFEGQNYNEGNDYEIMNLPPELRPKSERRFITNKDGFNSSLSSVIVVYADGRVVARPNAATAWIGLDGISYTLTR